MYLRTPKRYTRRGQRRHWISLRWLWLWITAPVLIFIGIGIYQNREMFVPQVTNFINSTIKGAEDSLATATAPTPVPTQNPRTRIDQANREWEDVGAIDRAVGLYREIWDAVPNDVLVHYRVTLGLIMSGRYQEALEAAERTVNADPFSSDAWAIRAWALDWNGQPNEAIASALMALELNPDNARALAFLGEAYLSIGQTQRALDTVNQALEKNPDSFEAHRALGLIYQVGLFDLENARAQYQTAYEIAPNMSYIAIDLALMESTLEDNDAAIAMLRDILDRNPENTRALYWIGWIYFSKLGDYSQSADFLSRCVESNPNSIDCHYQLGRAQWSLEQFDLARESFKTAIDLGSTVARHYWWAGSSQIASGNCSAALAYLRPGYELAKVEANTELLSAYEATFPDCQVVVDSALPEETALPEGEGS